MEYLVPALVALLASVLTLFSGFGLGTLLMPAFALFFPLPMAIALTAVVHLLNNIFKLLLLGRYANVSILLRFGIPSILFAYLGALLLESMEHWEPLYSYSLAGHIFQVHPMKLIIGLLMLIFAGIEFVPLSRLTFPKALLPVGGALSGFLGGLSGHQGALRSAFLLRYNLAKEVFIATVVVIAVGVDVSRLFVYRQTLSTEVLRQEGMLLLVVIVAAFIGSYAGSKLLKKTTLKTVQYIVTFMMVLIALALMTGLI